MKTKDGKEVVKVGQYYIPKQEYDRTEQLMGKNPDENILANIESFTVISESMVKER